VIDRAIAQENVWRAHRYGTAASFVVRERERNSAQPIKTVLDDFLTLRATSYSKSALPPSERSGS